MDKIPKIKVRHIVTFIIVLAVLIVAVINCLNNESFWTLSFGGCLTLIVAIYVSYFLVQQKTDERSKKEVLIKLISTIQSTVTDEKACIVNRKEDTLYLTMVKRRLSNYLNVLEKYGPDYFKLEDIRFIKEKYDEYDSFIGEHINDVDYLSKSYNDLRRPLDLIDSRLYEMTMNLYI